MLDAHCHVDLYPNPHQILSDINRCGITTVAVTNLPSHYAMALPHVTSVKPLRLALGLHPLFVDKHTTAEFRKFRELATTTSYIGEAGLDFSREGRNTAEKQRASFKTVLSTISDRPRFLSLHSRGAESEVLEMLTVYDIINAVFHWYSGPSKLIADIVTAGHYFSINPAMIRSAKGRSTIERIPRERILTETDGPYLHVGEKPAEPADVRLVLEYLAVLWDMPQKQVGRLIWGNFQTILQPIREWHSRHSGQ